MLTPNGENDFGLITSWPVLAVDVHGDRIEVVVGLIERLNQIEASIRVGEYGLTAALPRYMYWGKQRDSAVELSAKLREAISQRTRRDNPEDTWG